MLVCVTIHKEIESKLSKLAYRKYHRTFFLLGHSDFYFLIYGTATKASIEIITSEKRDNNDEVGKCDSSSQNLLR